MRIGLQDTNWGYIGAKLAQSSDTDQAEFFKAFVKEVKTYETSHQGEMQMVSIRALLTEDERELLRGITFEG